MTEWTILSFHVGGIFNICLGGIFNNNNWFAQDFIFILIPKDELIGQHNLPVGEPLPNLSLGLLKRGKPQSLIQQSIWDCASFWVCLGVKYVFKWAWDPSCLPETKASYLFWTGGRLMLENNECVSIAVMLWLDASVNNIISNNKEAKAPVVSRQFISGCHWP